MESPNRLKALPKGAPQSAPASAEAAPETPSTPAADEPQPVTQEHLQQLVDHLNTFRTEMRGALQRIGATCTQFDARLKLLEGANAHDRIISAAVAARVEFEAVQKGAEIARGVVQDALTKLAEQEKAATAKVNGADPQAAAPQG